VKALAKQQRKLSVGVGNAKQVGSAFVTAWKRSEKGLPPEPPINRLHFADAATLFKHLSPRRFELLQRLRAEEPLSIRRLATLLNRDYKNVHTDVKELLNVGLIEETADHLLSVPWDVIVSEFSLLAKAE